VARRADKLQALVDVLHSKYAASTGCKCHPHVMDVQVLSVHHSCICKSRTCTEVCRTDKMLCRYTASKHRKRLTTHTLFLSLPLTSLEQQQDIDACEKLPTTLPEEFAQVSIQCLLLLILLQSNLRPLSTRMSTRMNVSEGQV
jgi:hypothetical protein